MKKGFVIIVSMLLLASFIFSLANISAENGGNGNATIQDDDETEQENNSTTQEQTQNQDEVQDIENRIKERIKIRNRLRVENETRECPERCTCSGSTTKCPLENGREMTIRAGNSGNTIIQVKGRNMTTNVELYKEDGKVYGLFRNQTREIKVLPDQVMDRLRERIKARVHIENMTLDEDGNYQVLVRKKSRLFLIIPVKEKVKTQINSETGEIIRTRTSWWGFLARDIPEDPALIGGCGTVTPGMENECCVNLGYEFWNTETLECE